IRTAAPPPGAIFYHSSSSEVPFALQRPSSRRLVGLRELNNRHADRVPCFVLLSCLLLSPVPRASRLPEPVLSYQLAT
ncbi:hypothetical protein TPAR_07528, partial [Tolypocladium paradoxum]